MPPKGWSLAGVSQGELRSSSAAWSTGSEAGEEHILTLHVWSRAGGRQESYEIIEAIKGVLHDKALMLTDHDLVNLRHEFSEVRQDPDGDTYHGILRYRAVTEPAQQAAA